VRCIGSNAVAYCCGMAPLNCVSSSIKLQVVCSFHWGKMLLFRDLQLSSETCVALALVYVYTLLLFPDGGRRGGGDAQKRRTPSANMAAPGTPPPPTSASFTANVRLRP